MVYPEHPLWIEHSSGQSIGTTYEREYERLGDVLRGEGFYIDDFHYDFALVQIDGRLPATNEPFRFHGKRSTLRLDVGISDKQIDKEGREWVVWNKSKFLDQNGVAKDTFDLESEEDQEIADLAPNQVIDIFNQLVSEYRDTTSIEAQFAIPQ